MKVFLRIFVLVVFGLTFFSFYITRDGELYTPKGEGEVKLDSGTYEEFPLPDYASEMIFKVIKIICRSRTRFESSRLGDWRRFSCFNAWKSYIGFLYRKVVENLPLDEVRVIMPTSLGLGFSSKIPASMHTADNHIRWITRFLQSWNLLNWYMPDKIGVGQLEWVL